MLLDYTRLPAYAIGMTHRDFHPSALDKGERFRESLRFSAHLSTEHLDRAQSILTEALEKHGADSLTSHNFDHVLALMHKNPDYRRLYSGGPAFKEALRDHLGIASPPDATPQ